MSECFSVLLLDSFLNVEGVKGTWNTAAGFIGEDMPRKPLDAFVVNYACQQGAGEEVLPLLPPPRKRETPGRAVGDGFAVDITHRHGV